MPGKRRPIFRGNVATGPIVNRLRLNPKEVGHGAIAAQPIKDGFGVHAAEDTHYGKPCKRQNVYIPAAPVSRQCATMARGKKAKSSDLRIMVAQRLRAARMAYEPNAAQVARDLGVTPQVLNAYEKGRNYPDETFINRFCDLSGCPAEWIYRGKFQAIMPPAMAALIGVNFPELVPGAEPAAALGEADAPKAPARGKLARRQPKQPIPA
jgi:transcriptional regulator with XRE-family HTH domain